MLFVLGNGLVQSEERFVPYFNEIHLGGSSCVKLCQGDFSLKVVADSNLLPYIQTVVSDDCLKLGFQFLPIILKKTTIQFLISLPDLEEIRISGSGSVDAEAISGRDIAINLSGSGSFRGIFDYESVDLRMSGSGTIDTTIATDYLDLQISGSGSVRIVGSANKADIRLSGSGVLSGKELQLRQAMVGISGSGAVDIGVSDSLDAHVSGSGSLKYRGDPEVTQHRSGSGAISRVRS